MTNMKTITRNKWLRFKVNVDKSDPYNVVLLSKDYIIYLLIGILFAVLAICIFVTNITELLK